MGGSFLLTPSHSWRTSDTVGMPTEGPRTPARDLKNTQHAEGSDRKSQSHATTAPTWTVSRGTATWKGNPARAMGRPRLAMLAQQASLNHRALHHTLPSPARHPHSTTDQWKFLAAGGHLVAPESN